MHVRCDHVNLFVLNIMHVICEHVMLYMHLKYVEYALMTTIYVYLWFCILFKRHDYMFV